MHVMLLLRQRKLNKLIILIIVVTQTCSTMSRIIGIGNVCLTHENEAWVRKSIVSMLKDRTLFCFLVVIIELSTNCVCSYAL